VVVIAVGIVAAHGWWVIEAVVGWLEVPLVVRWLMMWLIAWGVPTALMVQFWAKGDRLRGAKCGLLFALCLGLTSDVVDLFALGTCWVPTESMLPTLDVGEHVLIVRRPSGNPTVQRTQSFMGARGPIRGEVLAIRRWYLEPDMARGSYKLFIKRCVAIAGDKIQVADGNVTLNGAELREPYRYSVRDPFRTGVLKFVLPEVTVGVDRCYVLGDNRDRSQDSRL
jgi:signal peptidase I